MKTLTEFDTFKLNQVIKRRAELDGESKPLEEQKPILGELLKLEGEKLDRLIAAADVVKDKTNHLKRVLVLQLAEGERAPAQAVAVGELHYLAEYFPAPMPKGRPAGKGEKEGRDGKRGKGRGKGRGGRGGDRRDRREAGPGGSGGPGAGGERAPRGDRRPPRRGNRDGQGGRAPGGEGSAPKSEAKPSAPKAPTE